MRKHQVIKTLLNGENIENECSSVLFPYFGEYYNLLIVVSSKKNSEVTGADASLMLNMLYTFDMWLLSEEDEFLYVNNAGNERNNDDKTKQNIDNGNEK